MRPFFSIIIPTYNPGKYLIRMLDSILHNKCIDKIEIIISDDRSTENIDSIVNMYKGKVNIRKIENNYHAGFPRNGRQHGSEVEEGTWFCFADQDDYFIDNAFDGLYEYITTNDIHDYIITDFIEEKVDTGQRVLQDKSKGWTHGKLFEKTFWNKYHLAYDDLQYCEDINLTAKLNCVIDENGIKPNEYDKIIYVWCRRNNSLADEDYFRRSMIDYVKGTLGVLINYIEKHKNNEELHNIFCVKFLATMLHVYFYHQSSILDGKELLLKTILTMQPFYTRFKEDTGVTNDGIAYAFTTDLRELYQKTRSEDYSQIPFVETISFKDWLNSYLD